MDPLRWRQLRALLDQALDLPPDRRDAFAREHCGDDTALRDELLALIAASSRHDAVLDDAGGAAAVLGIKPPLPARVGPYEPLSELGRGGMGVVYLAERADGFKQRVALKVIGAGQASAEAVTRFQREREILARLTHPHIAQLHDGGLTDTGLPWFAMEYIHGVPITDWCERQHADPRARVDLLLQVIEAVDYAHRSLVVHRDLKPSNILVDGEGRVKLLDFGIAKLLDEAHAEATQTAAGPLTPHYAAPEQIRGEPISTATDVHALGVILFELLTGTRPYGATTKRSFEIQREVLEREPPRLIHARGVDADPERAKHRYWRAALRGDLQRIVDRCLDKSPARRYGTAAQLGEDLRAWREGRPVSVGVGRAYRLRKLLRRHAWTVAGASVVIVTLIAATAISLRQARIAREQAQLAEETAATATAAQRFMIESYATADPYATDGKVVTARELLEAGAARVDQDLAAAPRVRAELHQSFGKIFSGLDQHDRALPHYRAAMDLMRGWEAPDSDALLRLEAGVAEQEFYVGSLATTAAHFDRLLERLRDRPTLADVRMNMLVGTMLARTALGRYESAAQLTEQELLPLTTALGGGKDYDTSFALYNLAIVRLQQMRPVEAARLVERNVAIDVDIVGPEHPGLLSDTQFVARLLVEFDRLPQAQALFDGVLELRSRLFPADHPLVAISRGNLARGLAAQGRYAEAVNAMGGAIAAMARKRAADSDEVALMRQDYGAMLMADGRLEDARRELEAAFKVWIGLDGEQHPEALRCRVWLAQITAREGHRDEALAALRDVARQQQTLDHGAQADTWLAIAELAPDEASALRERAAALMREQGRILALRQSISADAARAATSVEVTRLADTLLAGAQGIVTRARAARAKP